MTQHHNIVAELERQYVALKDAVLVGPKALAYKAYATFAKDEKGEVRNVDPNLQYASVEHITNMARRFLSKKNDPDGDDNEVYGEQGAFSFSGQLQDRYPVPHGRGEEPLYKKRSHLTAEERAWNVQSLRKSARSRQEHADALEAEEQGRAAA